MAKLVITPPGLKEFMNELAKTLEAATTEFFARRMGFSLLVHTLDDDGQDLHYVSNCDREDMITSLLEFVHHQDPTLLKQAVDRITAQLSHGPGAERSN